ncbi:hypothetical protein [Halomonas montanilacus]|uniref:hypothetical protein n=1 Tax=Billgrantia montanilacus TaxID=2282305 RepID=UPI0015F10333
MAPACIQSDTGEIFLTVVSRLIGHQLRVHLHDDRLEVFVGGSSLLTLTRGRA